MAPFGNNSQDRIGIRIKDGAMGVLLEGKTKDKTEFKLRRSIGGNKK